MVEHDFRFRVQSTAKSIPSPFTCQQVVAGWLAVTCTITFSAHFGIFRSITPGSAYEFIKIGL
jgi:hypothetical protein